MKYIEVKIELVEEFQDIVVAELSLFPFDTFTNEENHLLAYIPLDEYKEEYLLEIKDKYAELFDFPYEVNEMEDKNWNEEWEKNFDPVFIDDQCVIKAHFHKIEKKYPYEILITPKMSFGTGHHATTELMIRYLLELDITDKKVMDAGTGTGVLAIMASIKKAKETVAFDIDDWSFENAKENIGLNSCNNVSMQQGTVESVNINGTFDIILANINKNVLLKEIEIYSQYLLENGYLVLSGFYQNDIQDLVSVAQENGLVYVSEKVKDNWSSVLLSKKA